MKKTFTYNITSDDNGRFDINTTDIITDMISPEGLVVELVNGNTDLDLYVITTNNEVLSSDSHEDQMKLMQSLSPQPIEENNTLRFAYITRRLSNYKNTEHKITVSYDNE